MTVLPRIFHGLARHVLPVFAGKRRVTDSGNRSNCLIFW